MNVCPKCREYDYFSTSLDKTISCTIDENDLHHSYNDEPSKINKTKKYWHKHGKQHRENAPAVEFNKYKIYHWYYNNEIWIQNTNKPKDNTILIDKYDINCNQYWWDKMAIILEQMTKYDPNVYLCLIENTKIYVEII